MSGDDDLGAMLEALKGDYRCRLPDTLGQIETAWAAIEDGSADAACVKSLERALHSIAGAAGTFGLPALSEAAAAAETFVESCLEQATLPAPAEVARLGTLLEAVKKEAA